MKRSLLNCVSVIAFTSLAAANANEVSLKSMPVDCSSLNGTWAGYVSNPPKLFHDGGPWTIQLQIKEKQNQFIGEVSIGTEKPSRAPDNVKDALMKTLRGQCQQGKLQNVFLGNHLDCGHFAEPGLLITEKMMLINLPYENAMTDSTFTAMLVKTSHQITSERLGDKAVVKSLDNVKSCH